MTSTLRVNSPHVMTLYALELPYISITKHPLCQLLNKPIFLKMFLKLFAFTKIAL